MKVSTLGRRGSTAALAATIAALTFVSGSTLVSAADHAESISVADDPAADLGDVYAFLDPNDNGKVVLAMTVSGFIVPAEALNLGFFPSDITYRFEIENTGDAAPDRRIDITFSTQTARNQPQTATIRMPDGRQITAPTTVQTLAATANPFVVTTDSPTGVAFFAGLTDDPFFFDIVGFNRFVTSVLAGAPNATALARGRDSFAGYNVHTIALSVPSALLRGNSANNIIGVNAVTLRPRARAFGFKQDGESVDTNDPGDSNDKKAPGFDRRLVQIDRAATPAVATALIPFPRKNEFNATTPVDDAKGRFAADIVASLKALGTNDANIAILASVAVTKGDYLRLDLNRPNRTANTFETVTTPGYTGFPNGRRLGDDVIDTLLYFIANQNVIGDSVATNDVPLGTSFPFFALPQQPRATGVLDDNTRN